MDNRLSFYTPKNSLLHRLNPLTKLTLVFAFILVGFFGQGYWTPTLILCSGLIPLILIGKIQREFFGVAAKLILPAVSFMFIMQTIFLPGGKTEILRLWFLSVELETVQAAYLTATRITLMISSFTILLLTTHPSELMGDLTRRGLSGQFAYVIVSTLQIIPNMRAKAQTIIAAQRSRGLDTEGTFAKRVGALVPLVGPLVFGSLVEVEERAIAIEARGFTSTRPKTFLRETADTSTDKTIRWVLVVLVLLSFVIKLWPS